MPTDYDVNFGGAADQVQSNFTEQMTLNELDLESMVRNEFVAKTNFGQRATKIVINGYGTKIPAYGTLAAAYHTPGVILEGQADAGNLNQRYGYLNDRVVSHLAFDEYDLKQRTTIDAMPNRKREMGRSIADFCETEAAIMAVLASRAAATVSGGPTGGSVTQSGAATSASALVSLIWAARTQLSLNNLDDIGRLFLAVDPNKFYMLASQLTYLSDQNLGNMGSMTGKVELPKIAEFEVFKTRHLPTTNISSATTGQRNTYTGDFRQTIGLAFHQEAFASLIPEASLPMGGKGNSGVTSHEQPYSPIDVRLVPDRRAFAELYIASLIGGHCIVRPEAAIELKDDTL